jgi:adenosylhomocysteinase
MSYLEGPMLRVCGAYARQEQNREVLGNSRIILLQNLLSDTEEFVDILLTTGADLCSVVTIPDSIDSSVLERIKARNIPVLSVPGSDLEQMGGPLDQLLSAAVEASRKDGRRIVIIELGGYFAAPLSRMRSEDASLFAGAVEDTTYGHHRYRTLITHIPVPVVSVARSRLKEIEARFVGEAAVIAIDGLFRELGVSLSMRNALIVGYGLIGKNIAHAASRREVRVSVYDQRDHRNLAAFCSGFRVHKKLELIKSADVIFSATGTTAISFDDILMCKDGVVLASAGFKDIEFDVNGLRENATDIVQLSAHVEGFLLPSSNVVYVIERGTAVNFLVQSVPSEVTDLVFSELLLSAIFLLRSPGRYSPRVVHETDEKHLSMIAKDWLRNINH